MAFLKMAVIPERRDNFVRQFEAAMKEGRKTTSLYAGHLLDGWRMHIDTLCLYGYGDQVTCPQIMGSRPSFLMSSM